jgi:two-component system sensor histidine kinase DctS
MLLTFVPRLRRRVLWAVLVILVLSMLSTLVWLAGRYEVTQVQSRIERDAADAVSDIRTALTRNVQSLQALQYANHSEVPWTQEASSMLREHREWLRLELRDTDLRVIHSVDTPFRAPVFSRFGRGTNQPEVVQACGVARRQSGPGYGSSTYVPQANGLGLEIMDLCLPVITDGQLSGFTVATYSLSEILVNMVGPQLTRSQEVSFTESDGTRLAMHGTARRGSRVFIAKQLMDLPGRLRWSPCWSCWRVTCADASASNSTWPMPWHFAKPWKTHWSPACVRVTAKGASPM